MRKRPEPIPGFTRLFVSSWILIFVVYLLGWLFYRDDALHRDRLIQWGFHALEFYFAFWLGALFGRYHRPKTSDRETGSSTERPRL